MPRCTEYDADHDSNVVYCDSNCGALLESKTCEELLKAYEHWRYHEYFGGCSHGR